MAQIPNYTAAMGAQSVVEIAVGLNCRPGDVIDGGRFVNEWDRSGAGDRADMNAAIAYAEDPVNDLISKRADGQHVLTERGYDQGGGESLTPSRSASLVVDSLTGQKRNYRPGSTFTAHEVQKVWAGDVQHVVQDITEGITYGVEHGWFEDLGNGNYKLTNKAQTS